MVLEDEEFGFDEGDATYAEVSDEVVTYREDATYSPQGAVNIQNDSCSSDGTRSFAEQQRKSITNQGSMTENIMYGSR